jgi:hypothetical protein
VIENHIVGLQSIMTPSELRFVIWIALAGEVICYLSVISYFFRYLRQHHEAVWIELGSPSLFLNNSIRNNLLVLKFLVLRRYRRIKDPRAIRLGNLTLVLLLAGLCIFLVLSTLPRP